MNNAPTFSQLVNGITTEEPGKWSVNITENWMQGRTTYGGLSAALCLRAVEKTFPELPPLRSAQVNFIGPAGGECNITVSMLRQGKSVTYVSAEIFSEKGLATHAVFCFGAKRPSRLDNDFTKAPDVPNQANSKDFFQKGKGPLFANNYDCLLSQGGMPVSGSSEHEHYIWVRHKDSEATDMVALLGVADMPPPAVLPMFEDFAPISSMTWMLNVLSDDLSTDDNWWLMRSAAEHVRDGYSSQDMQIWNTRGELIISAMQNVAIFY